jgi:hypothetical protein
MNEPVKIGDVPDPVFFSWRQREKGSPERDLLRWSIILIFACYEGLWPTQGRKIMIRQELPPSKSVREKE